MTTTLTNGTLPLPKQIRFVTNQGQPPSKRRRINAACLTCRKRKTRCAGEKPVCSTCSKNGHRCLGYGDAVEKPLKKESGPVSGSAAVKLERGDAGDLHQERDQSEFDDAYDDEDERPHWKHKNGAKGVTFEWADAAPGSESTSTGSAPAPPPREYSNEWDQDGAFQGFGKTPRRSHPTRKSSYSEDGRSSNNRSPLQHHTESRKVPYFRYFGPTAIVPGYKQMVVNVSIHRDRRRSRGGSFSATSPGSLPSSSNSYNFPSYAETVIESLDDMPVYEPNDPAPTHPIIVNLVKTFFLHLGCNYPFLRERKCLKMLQAKTMEPILVDAMCALAARFSELPVLSEADGKLKKSDYGTVFAQRAKAATVDTFPCPSVSTVQALLLMAYEGFGANQDSALWMYLGCAIRMMVDLGLQTREGIQYQGGSDPWYTRTWSIRAGSEDDTDEAKSESNEEALSPREQQELERERMDTFWSVFMLDRVISSGTGRPVTFREEIIEFALPDPINDPATGWPDPFPTFIQIIHLYGRVSDVLNKIRNADDLTHDKMSKLSRMEKELTTIFQKQDPRLHFSVQHFQEYVKFGQGTTFTLLHLWFHALIIIIHQPLTLFGGMTRPKLLPDSRELSMSSAKTIADILAFAELIDPKSFIGNPFTSQPMYIAACAFLLESAAIASEPASREISPPLDQKMDGVKISAPRRIATRHSILASDANQKYQSCYNALQQLQVYWGGVGYILTALDQRSKGIWDCETFTNEEYESARKEPLSRLGARIPDPPSPNAEPVAISLTGTTNSPNPSLTLMYQNAHNSHYAAAATTAVSAPAPLPAQPSAPISASTPPGNMIYDPIRQSLPESSHMYPPAYPQPNVSAIRYSVNSAKTARPAGSGHPAGRSLLKYESAQPDDMRPSAQAHSQSHSSTPSDPKAQALAKISSSLPHHPYTPPSQPSSSYESSVVHSNESPASTLTDTGYHHNAQHAPGGQGSNASAPTGHNIGFHDFATNTNNAEINQHPLGPIAEFVTYDVNDLVTPSDNMQPWYMQGDWLGGLFASGELEEVVGWAC
ncbi:hypothetical protein GQ53DRAFT_451084 [Thozetella sp. PMI_491]|nr:hypothetical protein GQ53DRAFT_451084 [Thozetella sp. PMI_491]